ncbi:MAG: DNA mismatch repair endonuclease MutL [Gemmataceae bacterium]
MPRIRQLPPNVVTKIAAGEVIERPASVVKELLENAIDAGATRVEIELEQGGAETIRVIDDGAGIEPEDLPLAFASHATSKLETADDLFRVGTLGFRGEALASIGGVSRVRLQSRTRDRVVGAELTCDGGELSATKPWNGGFGTRIEVRHLFFNTPVRRKFLKQIATEVGHIAETVTRLALAKSGLHIVLRHNGKLVVEVPGSASLRDRIGLYFGSDVSNSLYELEASQGPTRLTGFVADPACDRGNPKLQYLFVNGRWIRDRSLGHALQEGYRGLLLTGRYAVAFLFVDLPADQVDVNVHPTKAEVRFRESSTLYHLVLTAVRERLRKADLTPRLVLPEPAGWPVIVPRGQPSLAAPSALAGRASDGGQNLGPTRGLGFPPVSHPANETEPGRERLPWESPPATLAPPLPLSEPRAIQLHDAYLVVETSEGMLVIDQHALHERILFEQLRRRLAQGELERQRLLIPEPIELTADQSARVLESKSDLAELGLEVADFGGGTVLLASYPAILERVAPADLFKDVVDRLMAKDRPPTRDQLLEHLLATMACRAAVKAGDRLTAEEIASLIAQRELAENTHHCPHGRPTSLVFTRKELDKQFRRT